ncbi:prepilin-type N-terminal cleavage/methylation domain-containing protein [Paraglaciecola sp. MB-3u-78]|jgi:MSHA pilin protein MshC|uniref:prepilin-type N-terminal cleavage/methylation domain-containing protein n=1 Tax=Paraglaciecola sp. MB-3u-78 TaxID=2058332 RepID=UPI000C3322FC|nr:prepilin-type N-terminal cleavage/methylation domain-containing protein [Paraglaciecola sp. MB-3u-78]PKG97785.1 prepilin-type cleavage/methylation domain-containing protein [Paraglaciecola sp. MB-3u-78]
MMLNSQCFSLRLKGFTLIELVIVIILISILSVTVFSRFSGTSGFSEYTYQARLISTLRNMQTRAMHDTRDEYCFQINFDSVAPAFGPPTLSYTMGSSADTCQISIDFTNADYLTTSASEMTAAEVSLSTLSSSTPPGFSFIAFNSLGQPITATGDLTCSSQCKIILTGESAVSVCIEPQGYIHACE